MGNHHELLRQHGHYYRLYTQQFRQEVIEQVDLWETDEVKRALAKLN
jgi:hypothetical protein